MSLLETEHVESILEMVIKLKNTFKRSGVPGVIVGSHGDAPSKKKILKSQECKTMASKLDAKYKSINCTKKQQAKSGIQIYFHL